MRQILDKNKNLAAIQDQFKQNTFTKRSYKASLKKEKGTIISDICNISTNKNTKKQPKQETNKTNLQQETTNSFLLKDNMNHG